MHIHPVSNCTFIIRSQAEFSELSQTMSVRHILEIPSLGKRLGFADAETLLTVLRAELMELHGRTHSITKQKEDQS